MVYVCVTATNLSARQGRSSTKGALEACLNFDAKLLGCKRVTMNDRFGGRLRVPDIRWCITQYRL